MIGITEKKKRPSTAINAVMLHPESNNKKRNIKIVIAVIANAITGRRPTRSDTLPMIGVEIIPAMVINATCKPTKVSE